MSDASQISEDRSDENSWRTRAFDLATIDAVCDSLAAAEAMGFRLGDDPITPANFRRRADLWRQSAEVATDANIERATRSPADDKELRFRAACEIFRRTKRGDIVLEAWTMRSRLADRWSDHLKPFAIYLAIVWIFGLALWLHQSLRPASAMDRFLSDLLHDTYVQDAAKNTVPVDFGIASSSLFYCSLAGIAFGFAVAIVYWFGWTTMAGRLGGHSLNHLFGRETIDRLAAEMTHDGVDAKVARDLTSVVVGQRVTEMRSVGVHAEDRFRLAAALTTTVWMIVLSAPVMAGFAASIFVPLYRLYRSLAATI